MNDDLEFVKTHIDAYADYADERARADSDMRVRAYVGSRLTEAQGRLQGEIDDQTAKALEDVLMRCMFSDQVFVRKFEHARLEAPMISALVRSDRALIEFGDRATAVTSTDLRELVIEIDKEFEYRRSPEPLKA